MNLMLRELKSLRKSIILWSIGIVAMVVASMSKYAGMTESGGAMNELMASMPKTMKAIMGLGELDISTIDGYYGMVYLYLLIMAAVHASMLGANIVAKEERDRTSEFLLVKPISRSQALTYKLCAAGINLVLFNVVTLVSSLLSIGVFEGGREAFGEIFILMPGLLFVQLLFVGVGVAIAAWGKSPRRAVSISAGVMLLTFLLSVAVDMSESLSFLRWFTPFQYFSASSVLKDGLHGGYVALALLITAVSVALAYFTYNKRDIRV
ncbi:ABC transporter permease [Paenibacillus sp. J5C_2022]|uniref:ABC transporter permease n=1 Tax=Paenibacillus sp. J5C2022 TaxID=2977129 RepID=UPI0021CEBDD5|nr:ABC transporter permease [Paenibacillus sp. J5C2022]MCU6712595.1 ABC transporter permease [Paenibacillus sp. J5C2022]